MEKVEIIENTEKAENEFGRCYGSFKIELTDEEIEALKEGKELATTINAKEYTIFISKEVRKENHE